MKYSKRYIALTIVLVLTFLLKLNTWNDEFAEVVTFRGATLQDEVFYPLKARSVNEEGLLVLTIGEKTYGVQDGVILGDHMQVLVSLDLAQELFACSANLIDQQIIDVNTGEDNYTFYINEYEIVHQGRTEEVSMPPELHQEQAYLPLEDLCRLFNCEYTYDIENYQAVMAEDYRKGSLPASFDLRGTNRAAEVRDQGSTATCWAQASLTALESSLLPEEKHFYQVDHMVSENAFGVDSEKGGEYTMALAYLLSWTGPVEKKGANVNKHVQEAHFYNHENREDIKWAVYQHGGVSTSIYASVDATNLSGSSYYNKTKNAYCYQGENKPNHDVVIIGWDDQYSKDSFSGDVPEDGAFICQNSWGANFGDQGVFYVSYYDSNIGNQAVSYVKAESVDNYDSIYQSDLCGWVGQIGYNKEKIHGANVFEATQDEEIVSAGFYALGKNTSYQVYMVSNYKGVSSLANRVEVASGELSDAGYYTVKFDKGYAVEKGEKFAIVIALNTPGKEHPMAIEYKSDDFTKNVDVSDGEGYISINGLDWESVEETKDSNLCIKAYGKVKKEKE